MEDRDELVPQLTFLGQGWSFPPEFKRQSGEVTMTADEEDIAASLIILLGTTAGERLFFPRYGLDMHEYLFKPMTTTMTSLLRDRVKRVILVYEPRIQLRSLELDTSQELNGEIAIILEYEIIATNSRYNLVYPFYTSDGNEQLDVISGALS